MGERTRGRPRWQPIVLAILLFLIGCGQAPSPPAYNADAPTSTTVVARPTLAATPTPVVQPAVQAASRATAAPSTPISTATLAPSPAPTAADTPPRTYIVQPGDTLSGIAAAQGVSLATLIQINALDDPDLLIVGQELRLPETKATPPPAIAAPQSPAVGPAPVADFPPAAWLGPVRHEYQRLNNCAPATAAMALSFYGEGVTQYDLAPILKGGDQDKNVSPSEIAAYLEQAGYGARVRVNGDLETLQRLIAHRIPVIVEQWLDRPGDELTGHYRLVTGYDRDAGVMLVADSYSGPNLRLSVVEFDRLWRAFHRLYIPVYRPEQAAQAAALIGADWDDAAMRQRALASAQAEVEAIGDLYAWFNLGDSYLALGQPIEAAEAFQRALTLPTPPRLLWYRFGPLEAYNQAGQHQQALDLADQILAAAPMLEEALLQRGIAYEAMGQTTAARASYEAALAANPRLAAARQAIARLAQ